jgi:hypothetical protein
VSEPALYFLPSPSGERWQAEQSEANNWAGVLPAVKSWANPVPAVRASAGTAAKHLIIMLFTLCDPSLHAAPRSDFSPFDGRYSPPKRSRRTGTAPIFTLGMAEI